ncbi:hypothetical protein Q9189_001043 [Teloschistes chrysophthalmus]
MLKSECATARVRLRKARPGKAPWSKSTFHYREQAFLEAAGVMSPAQNQLESMFIGNPASPLATSDTGDTQPASTTPANEGEELEALAARNLAGYEHLRVDAKQLQAQAEEARKHRVEVEASRDAIIEQARFECEQARLQHLIADEKAKAAVQKVNNPALRSKSPR